MSLTERIGARDPGGIGLGRGLRAAIVGPAVFAFAIGILQNDALALTAIFGGTAALLFADFGGTNRARTEAYLALGVGGSVLLAAGTWVSHAPVAAVVLTFLVVGLARFMGNLGPRWGAAMSPTILAFVLGALVPAPTSAIPVRMLGWGVGLIAAAVAAAVILPNRTSVRIDAIAAAAADCMVDGLRALLEPSPATVRCAAAELVRRAREDLHTVSLMPSRPSGAGADAMARRQILDRLTRVSRLLESALLAPPGAITPDLRAMTGFTIDCLTVVSGVLRRSQSVDDLHAVLATRDSVRGATLSRHVDAVRAGLAARDIVAAVDSGFASRACAWHADAAGRNVAFLAGDTAISTAGDPVVVVPDASRRGAWRRLDHLLGVHAVPSSVWFRDAARAGIALALSVALAFALNVDHAFWVALGTLSVLRSSAFATGRSAVSAALGTAVGFGVASAVFAAFGLGRPALWVLLVVSFFGAGYLPQVAGLVAGQAAFTVAVIALFNIVGPTGWHVGLVRLENVALGVGVSAVVAFLFWPRRLEPLVARLVATLSDAAGSLLVHTLERPSDRAWRTERDRLAMTEARTRAAMAEFLVQLRADPTVVDPWIVRLGVASHARSTCDAVVAIRALLPDAEDQQMTGDRELDRALHTAAVGLAGDLAPGRGAPSPPDAPNIASSTRTVAEDAVARSQAAPESVMRSLLTRDWLLAAAEMIDARP